MRGRTPYTLDVAASATIVLVAVAIFFVVLALVNLREPRAAVATTDPETGETIA